MVEDCRELDRPAEGGRSWAELIGPSAAGHRRNSLSLPSWPRHRPRRDRRDVAGLVLRAGTTFGRPGDATSCRASAGRYVLDALTRATPTASAAAALASPTHRCTVAAAVDRRGNERARACLFSAAMSGRGLGKGRGAELGDDDCRDVLPRQLCGDWGRGSDDAATVEVGTHLG